MGNGADVPHSTAIHPAADTCHFELRRFITVPDFGMFLPLVANICRITGCISCVAFI